MDALSEVLRSMRLSGGVFLRATFSEPWCLASELTADDCGQHLGPSDHIMLYHYVLEGALSVETADGDALTVHPGDAVVFPRNDKHLLRGAEAAVAVSALDVAHIPKPGDLMTIDHGGGGDISRAVCGFLGGPALANDPLIVSLPSVLVFDGKRSRSGTMVHEMLKYAADEVSGGRQGTEAMLARLSELLFIEAVRAYVEALPDDAHGWPAALATPGLARAVGLMHAHPEQTWTTTQLGRECGMSRSALAEKFGRVMGCTPSDYLTGLRMRLAARELLTGRTPILTIAGTVGYGSEAAFSRAFKREFGVPPSQWRRNHNQDR